MRKKLSILSIRNITLKSTFSVGQSESSRLIPVLGMILNSFFEDSEELLQKYFKRWNVDSEGFDILNYLNPEYFGSKEPDPRKPLTVGMLVESAKAGRWLYS